MRCGAGTIILLTKIIIWLQLLFLIILIGILIIYAIIAFTHLSTGEGSGELIWTLAAVLCAALGLNAIVQLIYAERAVGHTIS